MTEYLFKTPVVQEGPAGNHRLFYFYSLNKGISITKLGSTYSQARYLVDEDLASYDIVYRGGYEYVVDEATKSELIAGGVGITEDNFTAL